MDLKLNGQIRNQTILKFVSFVKQIEGVLAGGYQEAEIIDVVIRAMVPDMQLKVTWKLFATSTCQDYEAFCGNTFCGLTSRKECCHTLSAVDHKCVTTTTPYKNPQSFLIRG